MAEGFHVDIRRARATAARFGLDADNLRQNREIDYNQYFTVVRKRHSVQYAPVRERAAGIPTERDRGRSYGKYSADRV